MADAEDKQAYSAADIVRYHAGEMTAAERHALEKAALDDPFLSDAVDGYVHTTTPTADLRFLKQQLRQRSGNVVPIDQNRFLYLRIAAVAVLLAGVGWLALKVFSSNKTDIALHTEAAPSLQQRSLPQASVADTTATTSAEKNETTNTTVAREREAANKDDVAKTTNAIHYKNAERNRTATPDAGVVSGQTTFSKSHTVDVALSGKQNGLSAKRMPARVFKARVVDTLNNAVPYATVTNAQNKAIATTDTAGTFSVQASDSNLAVAINSVGFQRQQLMLSQTDTGTKVVLQPTPEALNEVVVTGYGTKKSSPKKIRLQAAEPIAGRDQFNAYANEHMLVPEEINKRAGTKEIVLSFDVDADGNAVNILVEKPLCSSCDSVAVRLIQESGKWRKIKKDRKAKARLKF